jgi:hypothetical protein
MLATQDHFHEFYFYFDLEAFCLTLTALLRVKIKSEELHQRKPILFHMSRENQTVTVVNF